MREVQRKMWEQTTVDGVVVARFGDPPKSYFTEAAVGELAEMVREWADPSVRAIVLAGSVPDIFITHFSAEEILSGLQRPDRLIADGPVRNNRVNAMLQALTELPKPVVVALNGDAMGFGFELALACDVRIGQRGDYRYGLPEVRMGILPGGGGTQRLARIVGIGRAMDLILRARVLTPEEALAHGLVSMVVDDALDSAVALAHRLTDLAPVALAMAKRVLYQGADLSLGPALAMETDASFRSKLAPGALAAIERYVALPTDERRDWLDSERRASEPGR